MSAQNVDNEEEIENIRKKDRACQGVTLEDEEIAKEYETSSYFWNEDQERKKCS